MKSRSGNFVALAICTVLSGKTLVAAQSFSTTHDPTDGLRFYTNPSGATRTLTTAGAIDASNPFFKSLGTNGRACVDCHEPSEGWSITPAGIRRRFINSQGNDSLFRLIDGANTPTSGVTTRRERRRAYSLLLNKGLIRVAQAVPANAEFRLTQVDDPYQYAHSGEVNMYRRPLPSSNIAFVSAVMWDGRESPIPADQPYLPPQDIHFRTQSQSAVTGHAEGGSITEAEQQAMVDFQKGLFNAQWQDNQAGRLDVDGAKGGPFFLSQHPFYMGINDSLAPDPTGAASSPEAFRLYSAWLNYPGNSVKARARRSIARGEQVFNTRQFQVSGVSGLNDELGVQTVQATCTSCHNTPGSGNHSMRRPLNIGLTDESERSADMPLYVLERLDENGQLTGETKKTTDPGRAMITGKWKDIGRFKGPVLRGLASRAPYFHNGLAPTLDHVVSFYDRRFGIKFTVQETKDLVAFLKAL